MKFIDFFCVAFFDRHLHFIKREEFQWKVNFPIVIKISLLSLFFCLLSWKAANSLWYYRLSDKPTPATSRFGTRLAKGANQLLLRLSRQRGLTGTRHTFEEIDKSDGARITRQENKITDGKFSDRNLFWIFRAAHLGVVALAFATQKKCLKKNSWKEKLTASSVRYWNRSTAVGRPRWLQFNPPSADARFFSIFRNERAIL